MGHTTVWNGSARVAPVACFDFSNSIGNGGFGRVLRNNKGSILALFSSPLQVTNPTIAKLLAVATALDIFAKTDWIHIDATVYSEANGMADAMARAGVDGYELFQAWW
ncbi:hypothetical protein Gotri_003384 [Gossypium trilobum]|uniref:RNase H type-1 domain-containing protein n=1 Tax=Gossypium trilobum TaxID=34281 RepID=A0A7J9F1C4_9ROSI|nr:hypothetical protein [Gossypium trilobum]